MYHGGLNFNSTSDDLVDGASLLPYPSFESGVSDAPLSISVTQFHFLLLYHDRLIGVGNLDERVAYDERLPLVRRFHRISPTSTCSRSAGERKRDRSRNGVRPYSKDLLGIHRSVAI